MKVRSLFLGSVAAAGLATGGAYAADLGVLTSLDVCDNLGLSGLTISSDTNCLQITGEVKYKLTWGDYADLAITQTPDDFTNISATSDDYNNWESRFDAWVKFTATSDSDFGPAKAVLKLKQVSDVITSVTPFSSTVLVTGVSGSTVTASTGSTFYAGSNTIGGSDTSGVVLDEAYVSIGEGTVISAGKKGSLFNDGDDAPLSWLGLFNSSNVDPGVDSVFYTGNGVDTGGVVIQVTSDLGNGFSIGAGLEDLGGNSEWLYNSEDKSGNDPSDGGTFVGVLAYAGDGISAHVSFAADGVLAGEIDDWKVHSGFTGTFDNFKVVAAAAFNSDEYYNVLAGASVALDMFTLAADVEAAGGDPSPVGDYVGAGASLTAAVSDGVTVNVGGRWSSSDLRGDAYQVAAGVTAALSETLKLTGEVGYYSSDYLSDDQFYGSAKVDWAPGGGTFTSSLKGTIFSEGGYKVESEFKKTFQ